MGASRAVLPASVLTRVRCSQEALQRHEFFRDCLAAQRISLKMASQVMLLRNLELTGGASKMLVNGSRGVIAHFLSREEARNRLVAEIKEARVSCCACRPEVHTPDAGLQCRSRAALGNRLRARFSAACASPCYVCNAPQARTDLRAMPMLL